MAQPQPITYSQPQQNITYSQPSPQRTVQYSQPQPTVQYSQPQPVYSGGGGGGGGSGAAGSASSGTIKQWAAQQDFLDVYMVNAFYTGTAQRSQYILSFWKTTTCFALQIVGIWLLLDAQWTESGAGSCGGGTGGNVALVAFFFATYVTLFCTEQIRSLNNYGMYQWGENQPDFVNPLWVGVGLWVNLFSLTMSWFASCIIIYASSNILDMVLNAVAVTFMITLDDEIIGESDYGRIENWDGSKNTVCGAIDFVYEKLGRCLLKIHPCWQKRLVFPKFQIDLCDLLLCPGMIIIPIFVGLCTEVSPNLEDQFEPTPSPI
eukprot:76982_1